MSIERHRYDPAALAKRAKRGHAAIRKTLKSILLASAASVMPGGPPTVSPDNDTNDEAKTGVDHIGKGSGESPEPLETRHVLDSDYIKALDEVGPGTVERILRLVEEGQRFEEERTRELWLLRLLRYIGVAIAALAVLGVSIYLIAHGEQTAAQTILIGVNIATVATAFSGLITERIGRRAERRERYPRDGSDD